VQLSRKWFSFGALVADLYCFAIAAGAVQGIYVAAAQKPVPVWSPLLVGFLSLIGIVLYHTKLSRSFSRLTAGEMLFGRRIVEGQKYWSNPYRSSRGLLFILIFVALVTWGNLWDSVSDERVYSTLTPLVVVGRIAFLSVGLSGLVVAARGRPAGAYVVAVCFAASAVETLNQPSQIEIPTTITLGVGVAYFLVAVYAAYVGTHYSKRIKV